MKRTVSGDKLISASLTAFIALAATGITALASEGWVQDNDTWYYVNDDGEYVYDEWKPSGGNYFYLGSDGAMLTDSLIYTDNDDYYYVNENGAMVTDQWVAVDDEAAGMDTDTGYVWYYFGTNGKAYKNTSTSSSMSKKTINGEKYFFDDEGHMLWGWVDEDGNMLEDESDPFTYATYYLGDINDGAMLNLSWMQYMDFYDAVSNVDGVNYEDYETLWFWFDVNGKLVRAEDEEVVTKTINGVKYAFDQNGVMLSSWINTLNDATSSTASDGTLIDPETDIRYFSDSNDGHLQKSTWIWAVPSEEINAEDYDDETYRWFYAGSTGTTYKNDIKTINNKKYAFDQNGIMKAEFVIMNDETGFVEQFGGYDLSADDFMEGGQIAALLEDEDNHLYYFSDDEEADGSMKTGKSVDIELDDDEYTFGFMSTGKAYGENGVEESSDKFYQNGMLLKASSDYKYGVVRVPDDDEDNEDGYSYIVVNTSGSKVTGSNKYVKDADGSYLIIIDNEYYAYAEGLDHSPVYYDGNYYEYDSDEEGNRGSIIEKDDSFGDLPDEMMLNF